MSLLFMMFLVVVFAATATVVTRQYVMERSRKSQETRAPAEQRNGERYFERYLPKPISGQSRHPL